MSDIRWFAPNRYTQLVIDDLRNRGFVIDTEGTKPARLAFAASGTVARAAWQYCRRQRVPLVLYIWDLPPWRVGNGRSDPVFEVAGSMIRLPRLSGAFPERREYYSTLHYIAKRAADVWVPSHATETAVQSHFAVSCRYVPYCYDDARFTPAPSTTRSDFLLSVSRLFPHKNHDMAIDVASTLRIPLRIVGRGPEEQALRTRADRARVRCTVETAVSDAELLEAYRTATVVLAPSRFEGFGLTGIEGASCGARVAASDIPAHREFLHDVAHLFPLNASDAAAAVQSALDSPPPNPASIQWLSIAAASQRFADAFRTLLH